MKNSFKEAYKPIYVPAHYNSEDSLDNKIIYALGQLEQATSKEVGLKLAELDASDDISGYQKATDKYLRHLYDTGLIKAAETEDGFIFNLSKIESPNSGKVDPDLLDENMK